MIESVENVEKTETHTLKAGGILFIYSNLVFWT